MIDYRLEEIEDGDIDFIYKALSDPELLSLARGDYRAMISPESIKAEIDNIPGAWWIIWIDNERMGWVRLSPKNVLAASLGIVIPKPENRNKGLGFEVCWDVIYDTAFPLFREVHWSTTLSNHASLRLADALGFEPYAVNGERIILIKRRK